MKKHEAATIIEKLLERVTVTSAEEQALRLACKLENENRYAGGISARKCQIIRKGLKNNPKRHLENNTNRIEK